MDAMALLCMLHADGPSTLKSLRQAGCGSLESIESMEEERLAKVLGGPPAAARRFVREARHLRERLGPERLGGGILDREESVVEALAAPLPDFASAPASTDSDVLRDEEFATAGGVEPDAFDEALAAWRTLDLEQPEGQPEEQVEELVDELPPAAPRARAEFEFGAELASAMRTLAEPEPEPEPAKSGTQLVPGRLDGLEPELCLELVAAGLETIEELADSDPLRLSESLGIPYSRLWRLACIARRATAAPPAEPPQVLHAVPAPQLDERPVDAKLSPSERPWKPTPSILELEWNREIRPQAPPPGRVTPGTIAPVSPHGSEQETAAGTNSEAEGAGGPFA
jgi:hypothetical protein